MDRGDTPGLLELPAVGELLVGTMVLQGEPRLTARETALGYAGRMRSNTSPVASAWTNLSTMSIANSLALHCDGS